MEETPMRSQLIVRALTMGALVIGSTACSAIEGATVAATLRDGAIAVSPATAAAGTVRFDVENAGTLVHEFEVFRTDLQPDALPTDGAVVDDEGLEAIDEVEDVAPGTSTALTVDLSSGSYVLICNLPDHYAKGMHAGFTVS
jgi:uncharacterized cupredoxin-like copper-binding protein